MNDEFVCRKIHASDGTAFGELVQSSPDTGRIGAKAIYQLDPYHVTFLQHAESDGIVVESQKDQKLVGAGLFGYKHGMFEGEIRDYALLHNLVVHPLHRRQGIATKINQQRLASVLQRLGGDGVVIASIQQGNTGSLLTSRKWCTQLVGEVYATLSKMRTSSPDPIPLVFPKLG